MYLAITLAKMFFGSGYSTGLGITISETKMCLFQSCFFDCKTMCLHNLKKKIAVKPSSLLLLKITNSSFEMIEQ